MALLRDKVREIEQPGLEQACDELADAVEVVGDSGVGVGGVIKEAGALSKAQLTAFIDSHL